MPRDAHKNAVVLTPAQAQYVLDRLVRDGRVTTGEIAALLRQIPAEIAALERRIGHLRQGTPATVSASSTAPPASSSINARGRRNHSAAGKLGLRFSGLLRHLTPDVKAALQALRAEQGIEAAVQAAVAAHRT